jgi:hypothetical protein
VAVDEPVDVPGGMMGHVSISHHTRMSFVPSTGSLRLRGSSKHFNICNVGEELFGCSALRRSPSDSDALTGTSMASNFGHDNERVD